MTIFDLLFLLLVFGSAAALAASASFALKGRAAVALRILRAYGFCLLAYFAVALAVAFLRPQHVISLNDPWCFDDWCLQARTVERAADGAYEVRFRIFSEARGVTQRANGAWIYLIDPTGRRFPPVDDPAATPLTAELAPRQSIETSRRFIVPADAGSPLGLITGHGGPYCGAMSVLIIGQGGCLFNRPAMFAMPK